MKAVRIHETGGPDKVVIDEIPRPEPGEGEVLLEVRAAALNHLDIWVRRGEPAPVLPHTLGSDGAGVVVALGPGAAGVEVGAEVLLDPGISCGRCEMCTAGEQSQCFAFHLLGEPVDGTLAEYIVAPARNCYPKPACFSFEEAAAFGLVFTTAYRMVATRAEVRAGETVLVTGIGGGVATAALAVVRALGARAIVTSGSDEKIARAKTLGAFAGVNYKTAGRELAKMVKEANGGRGVDAVVDSTGAASWAASLRALRKGGRLVTCGATSGGDPPADIHRIFWNQLSILGSTMGSARDMRRALRLAEQGLVRPVVDSIFPLERAREAMARLEAAEQFGKVVVKMK
jgi:NADPH:quinone reductase-like Zn-dependent oxidoreductase